MVQRSGDSGPLSALRDVTAVVPNITDGDHADVVLTADAAFKGTGQALQVAFKGAPLDNLGLLGAWVSNTATGEVTVRFAALSNNVATANQAIRLWSMPTPS